MGSAFINIHRSDCFRQIFSMRQRSLTIGRKARWTVTGVAILLVTAIHGDTIDYQADTPDDRERNSGADRWYSTIEPIAQDELTPQRYFSFSSQDECERLR